MSTVTELTPKQKRRNRIKAEKRNDKSFRENHPEAYQAGRVDLATQLAESAHLVRSNKKQEYTFLLSPKMLAPDVVLRVNYRWMPNIHYVPSKA